MSGHQIRRRAFLAGAGASLVAWPSVVRAQQRGVPRIAYLSANPAGDFRSQAFRDGLLDFGYAEGRDIVIDYFLSPTNTDLPIWAAKAVASKPDLIVAINVAVQAAREQTTSIPIVGASVAPDQVASYAHPGGNLTGPTTLVAETAAKRLQMLSQFVPRLKRVAVLYQLESSTNPLQLSEVLRAGQLLGIEIRSVGVRPTDEMARAIASAASESAQAIYFQLGPILANNPKLFADEALRRRLPSVSDNRILPDSGGLFAYGGNVPALYRRAAYYVDRILKGAKPADLPVEQPTVFDFVINKRTADALGLEIPLGLLVQATEIIE